MSGWMAAALLLLAGLVAILYVRLSSRTLQRRHDRLSDRLSRMQRGRVNPAQAVELLGQIYDLIHAGIVEHNPPVAYQAIDLLKTAFGAAIIRPDEPPYLTAVIIQALRAKELDAATAALDAYRQMMRHLSPVGMAVAMEQLGFVAAVAQRDKQSFLAAKAADIVFGVLERPEGINDPAIIAAALRTLRLIGVLALRRRDNDLLRELANRMAGVLSASPEQVGMSGEFIALAAQWLHRIVKLDDPVMFAVLTEMILVLTEKNRMAASDLLLLIKEWQNLAGTSCLNPHSVLAEGILEFTLKLALESERLKVWEQTVIGAGQVARLSILRHGVKAALPRILPLFSMGRELLALELKFGSAENADSFRQQALHHVVRECVGMAEFAARQDLISTAGDVIADICRYWTEHSIYASPKAIKRFCQLLLAYWTRTSRQAKKIAINSELAEPVLLSELDKQRLGFMI
ncbi:MAG: hypothetical protein P4N59_02315 [Negativicutes bacterium]|nr:hypothetical protein [Negativicutes bacterium]